ncbi:Adhesin/invasin protein PagN [Legionella beliardensis]|uniref:Adhesin/invasin protein PagN n=1 Tax=Legionella beliardensis TaxID=91822 RepID=A0A378JSH2_9GAMM|nr:outer membrane beta-barrel protein [Legionella beliardensis]STX55622.1 Adhesin/invasin protein PagN [Legionella beliardensis]
MTLKAIMAAALCFSNGFTVAGTMGDVAAPAPRFYIGVEGGGSISLDTHFQPIFSGAPTLKVVAPNNSDWSRDFGVAGFGGLFAGYAYNPNLAFQFTWDYRSGYNYDLQAAYGIDAEDPNYFIQDRYEAQGIKIQTFLFDMILKPTVNWGGFVPYVKGGVGVAYNKIKNLRNVEITFNNTEQNFDLFIPGESETSFAWDAGVGANYFFTDSLSIGLGYRFVDAGELRTKRVSSNIITGSVNTITPFKAKHFLLNEVMASIAYHFDYA